MCAPDSKGETVAPSVVRAAVILNYRGRVLIIQLSTCFEKCILYKFKFQLNKIPMKMSRDENRLTCILFTSVLIKWSMF